MEVILARGSAPLSKLIMCLTGGRFSHTALRYGGADSEWLVHAFIYGVVPDWFSYFQDHYKALDRFKVIRFEKEAEQALDLVSMKYRHRAYDIVGMLGHAVTLCLAKVGIKVRPFGNKNAFMCTELVAEWMKEFSALAGVCLPDLTRFSTPSIIEGVLLANSDIFLRVENDT